MRFNATRLAQCVSLILVAFLVLPPLVILVISAFSSQAPGDDLILSLLNARRAFSNEYLSSSLVNSFIYATFTSSVILVLGTVLAFVVERTNSTFSRYAEVFSVIPVLMPAVLLVSAWIMLLSPRGGFLNLMYRDITGTEGVLLDIFSFQGMILVGVLQELPLAFLWLQPVFRAMNPELEEAARVSGASHFRTLFKVTLPSISPALLGAWLIFFIYSFGALSVPILLGMPAKIFLYSSEIYLASTRIPTDYGAASFYSLFLLGMTVVAIIVYNRLMRNADRFTTIRGKSFNPRRFNLGRFRIWVDCGMVVVILLTAVFPILILTWNAFMPFPQTPSWESLQRVTFGNFAKALNYGPAMRAIWNSFWIGLLAGIITTTLGAWIAWLKLRSNDRYRLMALSEQIGTAPIAIPGMIVGVGLIWLFLTFPVGVYASPWILLLAYIILHLPYAIRMCASGLAQLHPELEEAARVAGANWFEVVRKVVLALMAPTLISAAIYVSLRSFREYAASLFLIAPGTEVFSVVVLDMWQGGNSNTLAAYTVLVMIFLLLMLTGVGFLNRRVGVPNQSNKTQDTKL
ncbi:iron ABC transporter permease [Alcaligenaceae bacterium CGII-47]|nr:iron ABC transporter permease [Alcaligenaceae bacterium CGII-47]